MNARKPFSLGVLGILFGSILSLTVVFGMAGCSENKEDIEARMQMTRPMSFTETQPGNTFIVYDLPQIREDAIGLYRIAIKRDDGILFSALSKTEMSVGEVVYFLKGEYIVNSRGDSAYFWYVVPRPKEAKGAHCFLPSQLLSR